MAVRTQGSSLFALYPIFGSDGNPTGEKEVIEIECALTVATGGTPADQIDITCLKDRTRAYLTGLRTPGQATVNLDADPKKETHFKMHRASISHDTIFDNMPFAYGWSDGTAVPTKKSDEDAFELPTTRSFILFHGKVSDFPFDIQSNSVVKTSMTIQRSGNIEWVRKA